MVKRNTRDPQTRNSANKKVGIDDRAFKSRRTRDTTRQILPKPITKPFDIREEVRPSEDRSTSSRRFGIMAKITSKCEHIGNKHKQHYIYETHAHDILRRVRTWDGRILHKRYRMALRIANRTNRKVQHKLTGIPRSRNNHFPHYPRSRDKHEDTRLY